MVGHQKRRHGRLVHPDADPEAGDPGLGHLEDGGADAVPVTDTDLVIGKALDREVLAELPIA